MWDRITRRGLVTGGLVLASGCLGGSSAPTRNDARDADDRAETTYGDARAERRSAADAYDAGEFATAEEAYRRAADLYATASEQFAAASERYRELDCHEMGEQRSAVSRAAAAWAEACTAWADAAAANADGDGATATARADVAAQWEQRARDRRDEGPASASC